LAFEFLILNGTVGMGCLGRISGAQHRIMQRHAYWEVTHTRWVGGLRAVVGFGTGWGPFLLLQVGTGSFVVFWDFRVAETEGFQVLRLPSRRWD
jgi:hypothetical protein